MQQSPELFNPEDSLTHLLRLLQLADSALPVGGLAHSFGLETMIAEGDLLLSDLFDVLQDLLSEGLLLDAVFCRSAHVRARQGDAVDDLNVRLSALRLARESREASLALGRRFSALVAALEPGLRDLPGTHSLCRGVWLCGRRVRVRCRSDCIRLLATECHIKRFRMPTPAPLRTIGSRADQLGLEAVHRGDYREKRKARY